MIESGHNVRQRRVCSSHSDQAGTQPCQSAGPSHIYISIRRMKTTVMNRLQCLVYRREDIHCISDGCTPEWMLVDG